MSNDMKHYTIKIHCNEAFYRALILMLRYAKRITGWGSSRLICIYCDGDGSDRVKAIEVSDDVPESTKGVLSIGVIKEMGRTWTEGDFIIDTDDVFLGIDG